MIAVKDNVSDNHPAAPFRWPVRVYYEDTDAAGVVYYANYLKYLERARTEWLRALGFEQPALARDHGVVFAVRALNIEYLRAARFDDQLLVESACVELRGSVIVLDQTVKRGDETLVTATVRVACVNTCTFKPVRIPITIAGRIAPGRA
jgi:acyl-CoA thioester hydrolase